MLIVRKTMLRRRIAKSIRLLEESHVSVSSSTPVWLLHNAVAAHMKVLVNSLLAMAILMAVVGTLGLTSTISMNVLERTREIGVMRAIGATPKKIRSLIVSEGLTIGVLSIVLAFIVSIGLSYFMGEFIGHISFRTPLTLTISLTGYPHLDIDCHSGFVPGYHSSGKKSKHRHHQRSIIL